MGTVVFPSWVKTVSIRK